MFGDVDVFISNYTLVDRDIYQLWIEGFSSTEAILKQKTIAQNSGAPLLELVASDVLDHYRTYSLIERLLHVPKKLSEQPQLQLENQSKQILIEKYFFFFLVTFLNGDDLNNFFTDITR